MSNKIYFHNYLIIFNNLMISSERLKPHNLDDKSKMNLYLYGNVNGNSLTSTSA